MITDQQLTSIQEKLGEVRCAGTTIGAVIEELRRRRDENPPPVEPQPKDHWEPLT